jgi:hypothetical protein
VSAAGLFSFSGHHFIAGLPLRAWRGQSGECTPDDGSALRFVLLPPRIADLWEVARTALRPALDVVIAVTGALVVSAAARPLPLFRRATRRCRPEDRTGVVPRESWSARRGPGSSGAMFSRLRQALARSAPSAFVFHRSRSFCSQVRGRLLSRSASRSLRRRCRARIFSRAALGPLFQEPIDLVGIVNNHAPV